MQSTSFYMSKIQSGFTLIEMMIVVVIVGVLASVATISYQAYLRKVDLMIIYQYLNSFRLPYESLVDGKEDITNFTLSDLNMPIESKYCIFNVVVPNVELSTRSALTCQIQNLNYSENQILTLDRSENGNWSCRASTGIPTAYLPQDCQ